MIKNLVNIQNELKAPKSNFNSFGKYRYRSAEDILTAVKPLLAKYSCTMTITDEVVFIGGRFYIKATATITDEEGNTESVSAFAREDESKKGMDGSQITGTASSYSRKYCLNGMLQKMLIQMNFIIRHRIQSLQRHTLNSMEVSGSAVMRFRSSGQRVSMPEKK